MDKFMNCDFNINKIALACLVKATKDVSVHNHRPNHGLALHTEGEKEYVFSDGTRFVVYSGDLIYLPKGSDYVVTPIAAGECYAINFDISEQAVFSPFVIHTKNPTGLISGFRNAKKYWDMKKDGYTNRCKHELYGIICLLQEQYFSEYMPSAKQELIRKGVEYIHENYTKELISIAKLAEMCRITPEYFRRIFNSVYGTSPLCYINNLKLTRANELLMSGLYSVSEAAYQSGFTDMSYFSRQFKKAYGVSPLLLILRK